MTRVGLFCIRRSLRGGMWALLFSSSGCGLQSEPKATDVFALRATPDANTCGESTVADGQCRVWISLEYPDGAVAGKAITLRTNEGMLHTVLGNPASGTEVTVKTTPTDLNGSQQNVAYLKAPTIAGEVSISAEVGDFVVSEVLSFDASPITRIDLGATIRTFRPGGVTASDFEARARGEKGAPSRDEEVWITQCCPRESDALPCGHFLSTPVSLGSSGVRDEDLDFEARLTAEGQAFLAEEVAEDDSLSIFVVASMVSPDEACREAFGTDPAPDIEEWIASLEGAVDVVELRLFREADEEAPMGAGGAM